MKLDEIREIYRRVWAVYEAFRKLGFTDDDVKYVAGSVRLQDGSVSPTNHMVVQLVAQDKVFSVFVGELDHPIEEAREALEALRLALRDHSISDDDLKTMWNESRMGDVSYFGEFAMALINNGFVLPALAN
jgi:hypothetical protein